MFFFWGGDGSLTRPPFDLGTILNIEAVLAALTEPAINFPNIPSDPNACHMFFLAHLHSLGMTPSIDVR